MSYYCEYSVLAQCGSSFCAVLCIPQRWLWCDNKSTLPPTFYFPPLNNELHLQLLVRMK